MTAARHSCGPPKAVINKIVTIHFKNISKIKTFHLQLGNDVIGEILIKNGANRSFKNNAGKSALDIAMGKGKRKVNKIEVLKLFFRFQYFHLGQQNFVNLLNQRLRPAIQGLYNDYNRRNNSN